MSCPICHGPFTMKGCPYCDPSDFKPPVPARKTEAEIFLEMRKDRDDLRNTFDLEQKCVMRATKYWQEKTGRNDAFCDLTTMLYWLFDRVPDAPVGGRKWHLRGGNFGDGFKWHAYEGTLAEAMGDGLAPPGAHRYFEDQKDAEDWVELKNRLVDLEPKACRANEKEGRAEERKLGCCG